MGRILVAIVWCVSCMACAHSDRDRNWVQQALVQRGLPAASAGGPADPTPDLKSALDEERVVALALGLNPTYRAELSRVDAARADLLEASRLPNPQLTLMGALGPISAFATLLAPLDSLWQLPQRSRMAARALESVAEALVQSGLDLARDARLAHAERGLAEERVRLRTELVSTWTKLAHLSELRSQLGEVSPAEAASLRAEAGLALDALAASRSEQEVARARLRAVLGLSSLAPRFEVTFRRAPTAPPDLSALVKLARASRPDVRAAELSIRSAVSRLGWERSRLVNFSAQLEGHWTQPDQLAARVGGRLELPIFNANPGGIGRANAELARADAWLAAVRQRVLLEIIVARTRADQALQSLRLYREQVLPALEDAQRVAARGYQLGEEPYMTLLDVVRRQSEARLREAELTADWRRAAAELERAVGARVVEAS